MTDASPPTGSERLRKLAELEELRTRITDLERELGASDESGWPPRGYYTAYYATTGFMLGIFGAAVSLIFNIIGSLVWSRYSGVEQSPLRLIQVYLTFPLGESALHIESVLTLAIGCCLYLATGMLYGIIFHLALTRWTADRGLMARLVFVSALSLAVWLVNFYGILSWLQPLLFGGDWIVRLVPWWVAALSHLVFGWTMVLVYPWGTYVPYQVETEQA
ncbi:MAG: hypothetical protein JSS27_11365 [Planctomycetes bacterium]|nr:hypothetical protein [Planctomycetota bacterium]